MTVFGTNAVRIDLPVDEIPKYWYNILPDLPEPCPPPLDPKTKAPAGPESLSKIFTKSLLAQEMSSERFIKIPEEIRSVYVNLSRPSPVIRAKRLEEYLR
ncbi:MAG TPA: hypothetical protein P5168_02610, partial [Candidatus Methanomethylicus sp.]|nr:hypothetical protein [Candidatus Methanomethylicus sp.]